MAHFCYSFCMAMLHSLWQAGVLLFFFLFTQYILQNKLSPLQKRNGLFILLLSQLCFFTLSFLIYFFNTTSTTENFISNTVGSVLAADTIVAITPWAFTAYTLILAFKLIKAIYQWYNFKKLHQTGLQKPTIDLKLFTALKANHFGIKRKVQLWFSNSLSTPITFGFLKPVIILPVALINQISIKQAETLILHELTHIKANDYLLNWALIITENIFFFNPFVKTLCKKIRLEREKYCDSNVIAFDYSPILYAETLLKAAYIKQLTLQFQLAAVTDKKQLLHRISFFTSNPNYYAKKSTSFITVLCSIILLLIFSATIYFQYQITPAAKTVATNTAIVPLGQTAFNTIEAFPQFALNVAENLTDENLNTISSIVEKQQPIIEKELQKLQPLIQSIQQQAETITEQVNENIITPVVLKENTPTKQIIVREEQSGSKNATLKVYTVSYINGKWVVLPEWMLAAKEVNEDSAHKKYIDSSSLIEQDEQ